MPPHVLLMSKMEELMIKFNDLRGDIKTDFGGMLDTRGVGGNEYHTNQILDAIKAIRVAGPSPAGDVSVVDDNSMCMVITDEESDISSDGDAISVFDDDDSAIQDIIDRRSRRKTMRIMEGR